MKKILTTLLLVTSLCGVTVGAELRVSTLRPEATTISATGNTMHPALLQRYGRRRLRLRRIGRYRNRNNGNWNNRRWNNRRWNNRRSNNRRWDNRRGRRRGRGHVMH